VSLAEAGEELFREFLEESRELFVGSFVLVFVIVICSGLYYRGILTFLPELLQGFQGFDPIPVASIIPGSMHDLLGIDATSGEVLKPQDYFYSGLLIIGIVGQYIGGRLTDRFQVEYGLAAAFGVFFLVVECWHYFDPSNMTALRWLVLVLAQASGAAVFVIGASVLRGRSS
jgi:hypothetical protein